ncbi:MAG: amidohydrolase family protein, partial [Gemmatimonadota bacterium]
TLDAAAALGVADSLGAIRPGHVADLVVLEASPLEEILNTRRVAKIVKGGRVYDPNELFEELLRTPGTRMSRSRARTLLAILAMLIVAVGAGILLSRHRRSRAAG